MMHELYLVAGEVRTHLWEGGTGPALVLLHGGEPGASAENNWEFNFAALAEHFHVYAPDLVGYGGTDKLFSFDNPARLRLAHIQHLLRVLCIEEASFVGCGSGGAMVLDAARQQPSLWRVAKAIIINGGGPHNPEPHRFLEAYDGSRDYMQRIHELLFVQDQWKTHEYVEKRYRASVAPGARELNAARLRAGGTQGRPNTAGYESIAAPVLICACDRNPMKYPDYAQSMEAAIPGARVATFQGTGQFPQIEQAEEFNRVALEFLLDR